MGRLRALSIWHRERAFDSAESCEAHRQQLRTESFQALGEALRHGDLGAEAVIEAVAKGLEQEEGVTLMRRAHGAWASRCVTTVEFEKNRG